MRTIFTVFFVLISLIVNFLMYKFTDYFLLEDLPGDYSYQITSVVIMFLFSFITFLFIRMQKPESYVKYVLICFQVILLLGIIVYSLIFFQISHNLIFIIFTSGVMGILMYAHSFQIIEDEHIRLNKMWREMMEDTEDK